MAATACSCAKIAGTLLEAQFTHPSAYSAAADHHGLSSSISDSTELCGQKVDSAAIQFPISGRDDPRTHFYNHAASGFDRGKPQCLGSVCVHGSTRGNDFFRTFL